MNTNNTNVRYNIIFHMYRSLVKNCPEFIRTSMLTFFHNIADDLEHTIQNLHDVCTL